LKILSDRGKTTLSFLIVSAIMVFLFLHLDNILVFLGFKALDNIYGTYGVFLIIYIILVGGYRFIKWNFLSVKVYHVSGS
jgi:hypothetical protein